MSIFLDALLFLISPTATFIEDLIQSNIVLTVLHYSLIYSSQQLSEVGNAILRLSIRKVSLRAHLNILSEVIQPVNERAEI